MKKLFFVSFFIFVKIGQAQNLVPNGSFENFTNCPNTFGQIYRATGWFQPHKYPGLNSVNQCSSSDYYNNCGDSTSYVLVPNNQSGFQFAHSGTAYAGIVYYTVQQNGNAYREYIEVKLNQTLTANKKYNLKYYVSFANRSRWSITRFDAHLSNDSLLYTSLDLNKIPVVPQYEYYGRINDTLNWVEINGSYTALGTENYLTLGNFHDGINSDSLRELPPGIPQWGGAYYYIDDVSLVEDTITGLEEERKISLQVYPNPSYESIQVFNPNSRGSNKLFKIVDQFGLERINTALLLETTIIPLQSLSGGVYYWKWGDEMGKIVVIK